MELSSLLPVRLSVMVSVSRRPGVEEAASPDLVCVVGRAASMEDTSNVAALAGGPRTSLDYTKGAGRETGAKGGLGGGKTSGYFFSGRVRIECTALRMLIFEGESPWIA